jgi:phage gp29-like protein
VALASGSAVTEAPGFVDAQLYGDKLTEAHTAAAIVALTATRDAIFEALVEATSYEELRERLRAKYAELDADDLTQLVKSALQLGALAGRLGVQEDVRR